MKLCIFLGQLGGCHLAEAVEELGLGVVLAAPVAELRARRPLPLLQVNADDIGCKTESQLAFVPKEICL